MWLVVMLALLLAPASRTHADALLKVGDTFPDWTLPDHTGATVSSADLAGKTYLLWFYPKAMTPGCRQFAVTPRSRSASAWSSVSITSASLLWQYA